MKAMITETAPLIELSEVELDAVCGGQTVVGGLLAVLAQVAANAAVANVTVGDFTQTTGSQTIRITG
jgi:hypothetical protein